MKNALVMACFFLSISAPAKDLKQDFKKIGEGVSDAAETVADHTKKAAKEIGKTAQGVGESVAESSIVEDFKTTTKKVWGEISTGFERLFSGDEKKKPAAKKQSP